MVFRGHPVEPQFRPTRSLEEYQDAQRRLHNFARMLQPSLYARMVATNAPKKNIVYIEQRLGDAKKAYDENPSVWGLLVMGVYTAMKRDAEKGIPDTGFIEEESKSLAYDLSRWWCEALFDAPEGALGDNLIPTQTPRDKQEKATRYLESTVNFYCFDTNEAMSCLKKKVYELTQDKPIELGFGVQVRQENKILYYSWRDEK
ncbi:hypothetical protein HY639_03770 [Candidatus Woesearchaeota archaeon]|nr:hypothetical protein [Candidatus Woesearchaeota archaeon]